MTNNNQTERVSDEELDQMILKLERDGMTPKQLSLMRELRELRKAKCEPVAPGVIATDDISYSVGRFRTHRDCYRDGWNACRAAMQLSGNSEQLEPVSNRDELTPGIKPAPELDFVAKNAESLPGNSPVTPDGWIPVSERMPPEDKPLLVCSSNGYVERTVYGFDGENWFDWNEQYVQVKTDPDELWQLLPAAPKEVG